MDFGTKATVPLIPLKKARLFFFYILKTNEWCLPVLAMMLELA